MTVKYIFTKNNTLASKIISFFTSHRNWMLKKTPSHVAILINDRWVFESTFLEGVHVQSIDKWKKQHQNHIIYSVDCIKCTPSEVIDLYRDIKGKKYDWFGVLYFGFFLLLNKFFRKQIPEKNAWQSPDKYFCVEVVAKLLNVDGSMMAPIDMAQLLFEKMQKERV